MLAKSPSKINNPYLNWWKQEKTHLASLDKEAFLQKNQSQLFRILHSIYQRQYGYRVLSALLVLLISLAETIDALKDAIIRLVLKIPAPGLIKEVVRTLSGIFELSGIVSFLSAKLFSFKNAPQNKPMLLLLEDIFKTAHIDQLAKQGPYSSLLKKFKRSKQRLLQHEFYQAFCKSSLERFLAAPFNFDRSISPALRDSSLIHKTFHILESFFMDDLVLVDSTGKKLSALKAPQDEIQNFQTIKRLREIEQLKAQGNRVFLVGHHEGYVGPYMVKTVLRRLGFHSLANQSNTVLGPRMLSNIVLKTISSNVGNSFLILPSLKTMKIEEEHLANALLASSKRTQHLIAMPNALLNYVKGYDYETFMKVVVYPLSAHQVIEQLNLNSDNASIEYLNRLKEERGLLNLSKEDYELFQNIMYEPFCLFPEGSRSYIDDNGDVVLKYVNPRFMKAYMRPGDYVLPISLTGGAEAIKGVMLHSSTAGFAVGKPYPVSKEMLDNYEEEGVNVMKKIAALPNLKTVRFDEDVQYNNKRLTKTSAYTK